MIAVEQHAELAHEGDTEQVDGEDLGAELAQLVGALIGEDNADEEGQQADDRHRRGTSALDVTEIGERPDAARVAQRAKRRDRDLADKTESVLGVAEERDRHPAERGQRLVETKAMRVGSRYFLGLIFFGLCQKRRETLGKVIERHLAAAPAERRFEPQDQPGADRIQRFELAAIDARAPGWLAGPPARTPARLAGRPSAARCRQAAGRARAPPKSANCPGRRSRSRRRRALPQSTLPRSCSISPEQ